MTEDGRHPLGHRESMSLCPHCQTPVALHQRICGGCGRVLPGGRGQAGSRGRILRVGRSPDSELVIPAHIDGVSRHHAQIFLQASGAFIEDLGSANGTFLNGVPVRGRMHLKPGDQVRLGSHYLLDLRPVWAMPVPHAAHMPALPQRPVLSDAPPAMVPAPAPQAQVVAAPAAPAAPRVEVVHSMAEPAGRAPPACPVCSSTHIQMNGAQQKQGGSGCGGCLVVLVMLILFVLAPALFLMPVLLAAVAVALKPEILVAAGVVFGLVVVAALVSSLTRKSHRCTTCGHQFNLVL